MTDYVETPADRKAASVAWGELSEPKLSTVAGGTGKKEKLRLSRFSLSTSTTRRPPVLM